MIGRTVAHYRILEELGSGGMGVVYRARDQELERDVALKLLPPRVADDPERLQRFEREARAVAALTHPNIVTIYSIESAEGRRFMTMELVEGTTLHAAVPARGLDFERFFSLGIALADAVSAAHEKGIVHRDLKPGNVMVGARGEIKVLDFGLAKLLEFESDEPPGTEAPTEVQTQDGAAVGTVPYMSPEQLRGLPADHRSDIFSLGVMLYLMATGRHPFAARAPVDVTSNILRDTPRSVSDLRAELPRQLGRILNLAMEKDPERRYQSAKDLRNELEALRTEISSSASVPPARRRRRPGSLALLAAILLVVSSLAVLWRLLPQREPRPASFLSVAAAPRLEGARDAIAIALPELVRSRLGSTRGLHVIAQGEDPRADLTLEVDGRRVADRHRIGYRLRDRNGALELGGTVVEGARGELFELIDRVGRHVADLAGAHLRTRVRFDPGRRPTESAEALELLVTGLALLESSEPVDLVAGRRTLERALEIDPGFALAGASAGRALLKLHERSLEPADLELALEACRAAAASDPTLVVAHACAGESARRLERELEAVEAYVRAIALDPTRIEAYEGIRAAHRVLRHPEEALRNWQRVLELHPDFWASHLYLGGYYFREGDYEAAIGKYLDALALAPENAKTHVSLGGSYYFLGRWEEAVQSLQKAIQVRPSFEGYSNLGSTYFIVRRFDEAVEAFERAAEFEHADYPTFGNLAKAYFWSGRREEAGETFGRAIEMCRARLAAQPEDSDAMILLAHYYAMSGGADASLEMLTRAMNTRPDDSHYAYLAGLIHSQLGHTEDALDWLERAGREGYSMAEIRNTIELDGLRDEPRFRALLETG